MNCEDYYLCIQVLSTFFESCIVLGHPLSNDLKRHFVCKEIQNYCYI